MLENLNNKYIDGIKEDKYNALINLSESYLVKRLKHFLELQTIIENLGESCTSPLCIVDVGIKGSGKIGNNKNCYIYNNNDDKMKLNRLFVFLLLYLERSQSAD